MTFVCPRSLVRAITCLSLLVVPAAAQTTPARSAFVPLTAESASVPALDALVSIAVANTPLSEVVASIAKQAGLSLTYDPSLAGLDRKISVTLTQTPAARAL